MRQKRRIFLKTIGLFLLSWLLPSSLRAAVAEAPAHHRADGKFRNNYIAPEQMDKTLAQMMRWRREAPTVSPVAFDNAGSDASVLAGNRTAPTVTWIGHATLLIQTGGLNILTDPHFGSAASPFSFVGPKRTTPPGLALAQLPPIDVVLLSHNHYDHLDEGSIRALLSHSPAARYLVPLKLAATVRAFGITDITEKDWGEDITIGGVRFVAEPCQHWSRRALWDRNDTLWAAWVVESAPLRFLFIGDTGYSQDFTDMAKKYGGFEVAAIPIGAYEPRWFMKNAHIHPSESVQIFRELNCRFAVATHWGSFILTDEPMTEPPQKLAAALAAAGVSEQSFAVFKHGEIKNLSFLLDEKSETNGAG